MYHVYLHSGNLRFLSRGRAPWVPNLTLHAWARRTHDWACAHVAGGGLSYAVGLVCLPASCHFEVSAARVCVILQARQQRPLPFLLSFSLESSVTLLFVDGAFFKVLLAALLLPRVLMGGLKKLMDVHQIDFSPHAVDPCSLQRAAALSK